jgi:hypothetical protein
MAVGYRAGIGDQLAKPRASTYRALWKAPDAVVKATDPNQRPVPHDQHVLEAGHDRRRPPAPARGLCTSQILVISMQDGTLGENPRAAADYVDMLAENGLGNYCDLLESVSKHPMMGSYQTSVRNQKTDPRTECVPEENYAREVMQLFSIGLLDLNAEAST